MAKNTNLINTNNNEHQINLDENLLGKLEPTMLPQQRKSSQEGQGLGVNIKIKTNAPEDLLPKLEVLGFKVTNFSNANSFTGTIGKDSLTQIIPFATQVTFLSSAPEASSGENVEELVVYTTGTVATTATATAIDSEAASLINHDDFQQDARFAGIDGSGYSIVIIDSGIDLDHEAFGPDKDGDGVADRIVYHYDFAYNDADASDVHGHGSHVSSIAASMAPGANIIHLKVLDDNGYSPGPQENYGWRVKEQALQWVVANASTYNVASVNISLGSFVVTHFFNSLYSDEYKALAEQDIVVSVASGNWGFTGGVNLMSADPNVFSVGSVDDTTGSISFFSDRHETLTTVFAPGSPITAANAYGGYSTWSGTSMAAPHVAGIAALAQELAEREINRRLTVPELKSLLRSTGVTIHDGATGLDFKRVDVLALGEAILALGDGGSPIPKDDVSQVNGVAVNVNGATVTYEVESYGGGWQDKNPTVTIDGTEVEIEGNGWKKLDLGSYNITENTVLEFEFRSTAQGEIHGIGFDNDNQQSYNFTFQLYGTQNWGINSFNDYITGEGWKSYQISVGDFFTGQFNYLTLVNDHDVSNPTAISEFRNIQLYEDVSQVVANVNGATVTYEVEYYGGPQQDFNPTCLLLRSKPLLEESSPLKNIAPMKMAPAIATNWLRDIYSLWHHLLDYTLLSASFWFTSSTNYSLIPKPN